MFDGRLAWIECISCADQRDRRKLEECTDADVNPHWAVLACLRRRDE